MVDFPQFRHMIFFGSFKEVFKNLYHDATISLQTTVPKYQ